MIEPVVVPILVDVDIDVDGAEVEVDLEEDGYDADIDTPIIIEKTEGGNMPLGGEPGDIIIKRSSANFDAEWVPPASSVEQDNTRPITAAAVYTEIGNINALLATI